MRAIDLTKLIEGLLVLILVAIALGQYNNLRAFAAREAAASLHGWGTHAFFPSTYSSIVGRNNHAVHGIKDSATR